LTLSSISTKLLGKRILEKLFEEIKKIKNDLYLETQELVSTCLFAIYNTKRKEAWLNISGDGVFVINDEVTQIDQNDKPNYLAYHLNLTFDIWLEKHTQSHFFKNVSNLAVSTDGILSFAKNNTEEVKNIDPLKYLLVDSVFFENEYMLSKKCILLEKDYQLKPNDDLGVVRLINGS